MSADFLDTCAPQECDWCLQPMHGNHDHVCPLEPQECGWCGLLNCVQNSDGRCEKDPHTEYCETCDDWFVPVAADEDGHWCDPDRAEAVEHGEMQHRIDRLTHSLRLLVQQLTRIGGYSDHESQCQLREARMLLQELEGK